jgi:tetratricopeptide (TPR) repeat protein
LAIENITKEILQHDDIIASQNTTFSESTQNSSVENENIIIEAQRNFDKSLDILNIVVALIGVLVAVLTLIIAVASAIGIFEYASVIKKGKIIKDDVEITGGNVNEMKYLLTKKEIEDLLPKEIEDLLPKTEKQSKELMEKSNEFVSRLESSEMPETKLKPDDYYLRGVNLFLKGKYEEAIKDFDKAPDRADALSYKGVALVKLGNYEEAIEAYDKAIELRPYRAGLWFNKGEALGKLGNYDDAIEAYDKAIELKSDYAGALYNRIRHYYTNKKDEEKALSVLKEAIGSNISLKETAKKDTNFKEAMIKFLKN